MSPKAKRLSIIAVIAALVGIAAMLVLGALRDNIVFFYTPTEITTSGTKAGQALRLGGLVKDGSVATLPKGQLPMVNLSQPMFWQSMMKITCLPKLPKS